jgi:hypothetical protein
MDGGYESPKLLKHPGGKAEGFISGSREVPISNSRQWQRVNTTSTVVRRDCVMISIYALRARLN